MFMSQAANLITNNDFDRWEVNSIKNKLHHKPATYHEKINLYRIINSLSTEALEKLAFPCHTCLVNAVCREHCIEVFRYMNYIADHIGTMTADEICVYRHMVPNNVRKKIESMYRTSSRLAHPQL